MDKTALVKKLSKLQIAARAAIRSRFVRQRRASADGGREALGAVMPLLLLVILNVCRVVLKDVSGIKISTIGSRRPDCVGVEIRLSPIKLDVHNV